MSAEQHQNPVSMPEYVITTRSVNTAGPGPFYFYSPGFSFIGLKDSVILFNNIPGGHAFKITTGEQWYAAGQLPDGMAANVREIRNPFTGQVVEKHESRTIPAQDIINTLVSDRSLTQLGLTQISVFDKIEAEEMTFNLLIHPEEVADLKYPIDPKWRRIVEQDGGMLALRKIWLASAMEALETQRLMVDIARVVEAKPYLLDQWKESIVQVILPALDAFTVNANTRLASFEESMRAKKREEYDPYAMTLMWCLGRKPERTALSRTLDQTGRGGLSMDDARVLFLEMMKNTSSQVQQAQNVDFSTCPDCGNKCENVAGGPPRICWRCKFEFYQVGATPIPQSIEVKEESQSLIQPASSDEIEDLAAQILAGRNH